MNNYAQNYFGDCVKTFNDQLQTLERFVIHVEESIDIKYFEHRDKNSQITLDESFNLAYYLKKKFQDNENEFIKNYLDNLVKVRKETDFERAMQPTGEVKEIDVFNLIIESIFKEFDFKLKLIVDENNEYVFELFQSNDKNISLLGIHDYLEGKNQSKQQESDDRVLLYQSAFIAVYNNIENTFAKILYILIKRNPGLMKKSDSFGKISYYELSKAGSIDNALEKIIHDFVQNKMYGGVSDWIKFIVDSDKKIEQQELIDTQDLNNLIEFNLIRNIIVHNNGIVNEIYLRATPFKNNFSLGDKIELDKDKLLDYIDDILIIINKLIFKLWQIISHKDSETRFSVFHDLAYHLMVDEKYKLAQSIFLLILEEKNKLSDYSRLMCEVNLAQTYKWLDKIDKMHGVLGNIDLSLANDEFYFSINLLKDNYNEAAKSLNKIIISADNHPVETVYFFHKWPIAKNFIKSEPFDALLAKHSIDKNDLKPFKDKNKSDKALDENKSNNYNRNRRINKKWRRRHVSRSYSSNRDIVSNGRKRRKRRKRKK